MKKCSENDKVLEVLMNPEGNAVDRQRILEHSEHCDSCREVRTLHQSLESLGLDEPEDAQFEKMRATVLSDIRTSPGSDSRLSPAEKWIGLAKRLAPASLMAAGSVALLAVGFLLGSWSDERRGDDQSLAVNDRTGITRQIEYAAARAGEGPSGVASPYRYTNLEVQELDPETVRLAFDVSTSLELVRPKNDPIVADVLVQALANSAPLGTRLHAIEYSAGFAPRVRDVLIDSMLTDESLPVRLKAIGKLTQEASEAGQGEEITEALLEVLRNENSVQMRLMAIDHLTAQSIEPELLREAVDAGPTEPGTAVFASSRKYLRTF